MSPTRLSHESHRESGELRLVPDNLLGEENALHRTRGHSMHHHCLSWRL